MRKSARGICSAFLLLWATYASADACYHCGETLPANAARIQMAGVTHQFCCDGCAAAAQWIDDADLEPGIEALAGGNLFQRGADELGIG